VRNFLHSKGWGFNRFVFMKTGGSNFHCYGSMLWVSNNYTGLCLKRLGRDEYVFNQAN
jgi:hypothetical protein